MRKAEDYIPDRIQRAAKAAGVKTPLMYLGPAKRDVELKTGLRETTERATRSLGVHIRKAAAEVDEWPGWLQPVSLKGRPFCPECDLGVNACTCEPRGCRR